MSKEWKCPKCNIGAMRQQGLMSCNWRCEVCGHYIYVPRPEMPKADLSGARKTVSDMSSRSAKQLSRDAMDAVKIMNEAAEESQRLKYEIAKKKERAEILTKHAKQSEAILRKYKNNSKRRDEELEKSRQERDEALRKHEKKWSKKNSGILTILTYFILAFIVVFILRYLGIM